MKKSKTLQIIIGIIVLAVIVLLLISLQQSDDTTFATTVLGIATFLFGFFVSFSISDRHNRIDSIRAYDSNERAYLETSCYLSEAFDKKTHEAFVDLVDEYIVDLLDYTIWDYGKTEPKFKKMLKFAMNIETKSAKEEEAQSKIIDNLINISEARKGTLGLIPDRLQFFEWASFVILSIIIAISTLFINTGSPFSIVIVVILNAAIAMLLMFLYSLDNLSWKEEERIFEPFQCTLENIGRLRYYDSWLIESKRIKKHVGKSYRLVTITTEYPDFSGKKIEIIKGEDK